MWRFPSSRALLASRIRSCSITRTPSLRSREREIRAHRMVRTDGHRRHTTRECLSLRRTTCVHAVGTSCAGTRGPMCAQRLPRAEMARAVDAQGADGADGLRLQTSELILLLEQPAPGQSLRLSRPMMAPPAVRVRPSGYTGAHRGGALARSIASKPNPSLIRAESEPRPSLTQAESEPHPSRTRAARTWYVSIVSLSAPRMSVKFCSEPKRIVALTALVAEPSEKLARG